MASPATRTWAQKAFREKLGVSIPQLSDFEPKGAACTAFGVLHAGGFPQRALVDHRPRRGRALELPGALARRAARALSCCARASPRPRPDTNLPSGLASAKLRCVRNKRKEKRTAGATGGPTGGDRKAVNMSSNDAVTRVSVEIAGSEISFETGRMAKQASGAVVVRQGDTMVLCDRGRGQPARRRLPPADGGRRGAHVRRRENPRLVLQARGPPGREGHADRAHDRPPDPPAVPQGLAL